MSWNTPAGLRSLAFAHPQQRSRGRPDSAGNVKKADLLRMRAVERMNRLGGRLQQDMLVGGLRRGDRLLHRSTAMRVSSAVAMPLSTSGILYFSLISLTVCQLSAAWNSWPGHLPSPPVRSLPAVHLLFTVHA